jgi:hypothetical protein
MTGENENYVRQHELQPRKDKRSVDLISDALPKSPCGSGDLRVKTQF